MQRYPFDELWNSSVAPASVIVSKIEPLLLRFRTKNASFFAFQNGFLKQAMLN